ncbi:MAG TPA: dihydrolipoyl dehydrogenase [Symbiobacteriaceae bacterium]|jgi:dihydrolipoamide dehydrogenase|nr:dihydrolipoyl dehydrogenase [Symbiobacteriaceae bacterium]
MSNFDVVVLGGGTGGYVAAVRGAQLGLKVALVEKDKVGGTCLHRGCIPSKAFLRSAEILHTMKRAKDFGLVAEQIGFDFGAIFNRKEKIVGNLHKGVQALLKKNGVTVIEGTGALVPPSIFSPNGLVSVMTPAGQQELLEPEKIIIATGSKPKTMGIPIDGEHVLTSDDALMRQTLPKSVIIIGGGVIGMEWASLYNDFGVEVTVLEFLPRILPTEDEEVAAELEKLMKRRKINIITGAAVDPASVKVENGEASLNAKIGDEVRRFSAEVVLVSVGREPVTQGFGLENREKIAYKRGGFIETDGFGRTGDPSIYAIGDVAGGGLAHVASHQGIIAMEHIKGLEPHAFEFHKVPKCVYTRPEVASVGYSEAEARQKGFEVKVGKFPFRVIGKAQVHGDIDGFAKLIADAKTGDLLGAHLIGPEVTNYISEAGLAMVLNASAWEIGQTIHPHPTLSEIFGEAALAVDGRAIHM